MKDKFGLTRGWIAKAQSDLVNAQRMVNSDGPYDTACFHAQQAIEKLLKAFLAFHGKPIPKTHDLDELQNLCLEITHLPSLAKIDLTETTDYAVAMRYDLEFWPEQETALEAVQLAVKILNLIYKVLPKVCQP